MRCALICLAACALLAGCGNDRTSPRDAGVARAPGDFSTVRVSDVRLQAPVAWLRGPGEGRQLATYSTGDAQISIWRYPRTEPLPETRDQLQATRKSLIAQVMTRDATFKLTSSRLVRRTGLRAVELVGVGTTQGVQRSIRSLHAYGHKAEVVVDAFAPTKDFPRVDKQTFRRVLRSVRLTRRR